MTNIERIRQALPEHNIPAMLITSDKCRLFATGFLSSAGALVVSENDAWLFVDTRYFEMAQATVKDAQVLLMPFEKTLFDCVKDIVEKNNIKSIGFEDGKVTYADHQKWLEKLGIEMTPAGKLLSDLRAIKSRDDLDKMIKAQRLSEKVFNEILPLITTEMTENDLAAEIIYRMLKHGADDKAFSPIVVSGAKSSMPHGVPGDVKIGKGFLTLDFGALHNGWCSDTTRTLCVGEPTDEMVKVYNTVLEAQLAGIGAVRAGASCFDVDATARNVIKDAGYGDYFKHGLGHGVGLEVHENPFASPLSKDTLQAGVIMTVEPGIYLPGKFGVRIEDTVYVTNNGCENITTLPKKLLVI